MNTTPHTEDGERFTPDPTKPLRLVVVIDNADAYPYPQNPYTLNAWLTAPGQYTEEHELNPRGEGAIIDGTIPEQLRALALAIEDGAVFL